VPCIAIGPERWPQILPLKPSEHFVHDAVEEKVARSGHVCTRSAVCTHIDAGGACRMARKGGGTSENNNCPGNLWPQVLNGDGL